MIIAATVRAIKNKVYAETRTVEVKIGDKALIDTEHGIEAGVVFEKIEKLEKTDKDLFVGKVIRILNVEDERKIGENENKAKEAFKVVEKKAAEYGLDMKLTRVQFTFDRSKLFVYYTSESRVDFRELIKDLGHRLKTRIQMVQIGVRDESKMIGGIGICGRALCCCGFLKDFASVTIDMAKDQDLSLNTAKLSGVCGRLLCCIAFENDYYKELKNGLPLIGETVSTPNGKGKLAAIDCLRRILTVEFVSRQEKEFKQFPVDVIKNLNPKDKKDQMEVK
ncbi:MAG: stage 0 sporulation protein [Elusimicrobiota bacterium]|jgi:cell fate regulator YaaT (PSP1 superfamily)|nr:stage 0 sporulation protein [Elusimicrobiota bacterium]